MNITFMKESKITSDALRFWLQKRKKSQLGLAKEINVTPSAISQIVTGQRNPSIDLLQKIADGLGVSLAEFFICKDELTPDIVYIEKVKARPRAGTGGLEADGEHDGLYSFHSSFIARKRGRPDDMKIFEVAGESMSPTLANGDLIMINLADKDVRSGFIYLLRLEDELMVKRLENRPGGVLLIRSDNLDYDSIQINRNEENTEVQIFGRMVWSCREY